jgi:hypothetical protein
MKCPVPVIDLVARGGVTANFEFGVLGSGFGVLNSVF